MNRTILEDVKQAITGDSSDTFYDSVLVDYCNSVFMILYQIGVLEEPFAIVDEAETWEDLYSQVRNPEKLGGIKDFVYKRVQLKFDPPQNSTLLQAMKDDAAETQWRMYIEEDIN